MGSVAEHGLGLFAFARMVNCHVFAEESSLHLTRPASSAVNRSAILSSIIGWLHRRAARGWDMAPEFGLIVLGTCCGKRHALGTSHDALHHPLWETPVRSRHECSCSEKYQAGGSRGTHLLSAPLVASTFSYRSQLNMHVAAAQLTGSLQASLKEGATSFRPHSFFFQLASSPGEPGKLLSELTNQLVESNKLLE